MRIGRDRLLLTALFVTPAAFFATVLHLYGDELHNSVFGNSFDPSQGRYAPISLITTPDSVTLPLSHPDELKSFHALINTGQVEALSHTERAAGVDSLCVKSLTDEIDRLQVELDIRYMYYEEHGGVYTSMAQLEIESRKAVITEKLYMLRAAASGSPYISCT